jgi:hypothetical protein
MAANESEEHIHNLLKQIALMEIKIKCLKEREIEQKNKASSYETLLKDGIPLNEHFLALKTKYNTDKAKLEKDKQMVLDEIKILLHDNDNRKKTIDHKKSSIENALREFNLRKNEWTKNLEL